MTAGQSAAGRDDCCPWWLCPNGQCAHGLILHDGDGDSEPFTCCVDGCPCRGES